MQEEKELNEEELEEKLSNLAIGLEQIRRKMLWDL